MNKLELVEAVASKTMVSKKDVEVVINEALATIGKELVAGEVVKLTDFGTFSVKTRQERNGTNPKTGEKIVIPAAKTVGFKASKGLKAKL